MIGDSNMNTMFTSLGCLLREQSEGTLQTWDASNMTQIKAEFDSRAGTAYKQARAQPLQCLACERCRSNAHPTLKFVLDLRPSLQKCSCPCCGIQVVGHMQLSNGGEILMRSFGRFNLTLWDQVIGELEPITARDIILVNFGAWYHRLYVEGGSDEWEAWKLDVQELLLQRLAHYEAMVVWKGHTTFHYDSLTGAYTGVSHKACNARARRHPRVFASGSMQLTTCLLCTRCGRCLETASHHQRPATAQRWASSGSMSRCRRSWQSAGSLVRTSASCLSSKHPCHCITCTMAHSGEGGQRDPQIARTIAQMLQINSTRSCSISCMQRLMCKNSRCNGSALAKLWPGAPRGYKGALAVAVPFKYLPDRHVGG